MRYQKKKKLLYIEFFFHLSLNSSQIIIKLIDHVQIAEKFFGKQLHVVVAARTLRELRPQLLIGKSIHGGNSQRFHGRLELTVCRQQIVVLRLQLQWKIGWCGMRPQRADGLLHLAAGVVVGKAIPGASADVLRSQQLRLSALAIADWRREWRFEIALRRLRDR